MIEGAKGAAKNLGIMFEVLEAAHSDAEGGVVRGAVKDRIVETGSIDGIIGASPTATMAATLGAEDCRLELGKDIDIVAKEANRMLNAFRKDIFVIHEDFFEAGRFMARALIQSIEKPEQPPMQFLEQPSRMARANDLPEWMPVAVSPKSDD